MIVSSYYVCVFFSFLSFCWYRFDFVFVFVFIEDRGRGGGGGGGGITCTTIDHLVVG